MFDLLGLGSAFRGYVSTAPPPVAHTLIFAYRCERCDVTGRTEVEGDARCWLCGSAEAIVEYRALIKDQHSLSGGTWPVLPEPCERLVERSPIG